MRRRLVLAIALVAAASVALFALPLAAALRRTYRDDELIRLQRDTLAATRAIDLPIRPGDPVELPRTSDGLAVYDVRGRRIAGRGGPPGADALVRSVLRSARSMDAESGGALVAGVPLLVHERVAGVVRAERSAAQVARRAHAASWRLAGLAAGVLALAALAALALGRRLAVPLERLALAARRLGDGDFAVRAPRSRVPEVDAVADALDATAQRLDDLLRRERAFSADASHQLRTPLAALRLELEAIELRGEHSPELAAALRAVDRLQGTVDTLLAVARDAPRGDARVDLRVLLDDVEQAWRGRLAADARPLRTVVRAHGAVAAASAAVVREILDVLVTNAAVHGAGEVALTLRENDGWLLLDVSDEGPGVPAGEEVFVRRGAAGEGGHGIGLALARSLAEAEGGQLTLTPSGPRPVFTLVLPPAATPSAAGAAAAAPASAPPRP